MRGNRHAIIIRCYLDAVADASYLTCYEVCFIAKQDCPTVYACIRLREMKTTVFTIIKQFYYD